MSCHVIDIIGEETIEPLEVKLKLSLVRFKYNLQSPLYMSVSQENLLLTIEYVRLLQCMMSLLVCQ